MKSVVTKCTVIWKVFSGRKFPVKSFRKFSGIFWKRWEKFFGNVKFPDIFELTALISPPFI